MILTCPQCETKYVVKDGAIPADGRQVRCASCKHSWHQGPETGAVADGDIATPSGAPDGLGELPEPGRVDADVGEDMGALDREVSDDERVDDRGEDAQASASTPFDANYGQTAPSIDPSQVNPGSYDPPFPVDVPAYDDDPPLSETLIDDEPVVEEDDFSIRGFDQEEEGARSGRLFKFVLVLLLVVGIAVAAFWYLAPSDLRARMGLTGATTSPLKIMLDTRDRQKLESGNELLAISGRIINPTDEEQPVPAIRAELRNRQSQQLIHSWTIRPQSRVLPAQGTTRFNSAEVDVPQGGDDISLSLGAE